MAGEFSLGGSTDRCTARDVHIGAFGDILRLRLDAPVPSVTLQCGRVRAGVRGCVLGAWVYTHIHALMYGIHATDDHNTHTFFLGPERRVSKP